MLRIHARQLDALGASGREQFLRRLVDHARAAFPKRLARVAHEVVLEQVRAGFQRASEYGITDERSVVMFVDLQMGLDSEFDQRPQFREVLEYRALPAERRMERIFAAVDRQGGAGHEQLVAAGQAASVAFESHPRR